MATTAKNSPCPCGSGVKYKKCCLPKDLAAGRAPEHAPERYVAGMGFVPHGARAIRSGGRVLVASEGMPEEDAVAAAEAYEQHWSSGGPGAALGAFVQPIIDELGVLPGGVEKAVKLGMLFWNLALLPEEDRTERALRRELAEGGFRDPVEQDRLLPVAEKHIARHRLMFPGLHRRSE